VVDVGSDFSETFDVWLIFDGGFVASEIVDEDRDDVVSVCAGVNSVGMLFPC